MVKCQDYGVNWNFTPLLQSLKGSIETFRLVCSDPTKGVIHIHALQHPPTKTDIHLERKVHCVILSYDFGEEYKVYLRVNFIHIILIKWLTPQKPELFELLLVTGKVALVD